MTRVKTRNKKLLEHIKKQKTAAVHSREMEITCTQTSTRKQKLGCIWKRPISIILFIPSLTFDFPQTNRLIKKYAKVLVAISC